VKIKEVDVLKKTFTVILTQEQLESLSAGDYLEVEGVIEDILDKVARQGFRSRR